MEEKGTLTVVIPVFWEGRRKFVKVHQARNVSLQDARAEFEVFKTQNFLKNVEAEWTQKILL